MIIRQNSVCRECGYHQLVNHPVTDDEVKEKILGLEYKCPSCGETMRTENIICEDSPLKTDGDNINYFENTVVAVEDAGEIRIDIYNFLRAGYNGILKVVVGDGVTQTATYSIDPIRSRIKKLK